MTCTHYPRDMLDRRVIVDLERRLAEAERDAWRLEAERLHGWALEGAAAATMRRADEAYRCLCQAVRGDARPPPVDWLDEGDAERGREAYRDEVLRRARELTKG